MDKEEILVMEAGEELDALVAQEIMGERIEWRDCPTPEIIGWKEEPFKSEPIIKTERRQVTIDKDGKVIPFMWAPGHLSSQGYLTPYSTDISAVWLVVEKVTEERHCHCEIKVYSNGFASVKFTKVTGPFTSDIILGCAGIDNDETVPEAICKAALLTKVKTVVGY